VCPVRQAPVRASRSYGLPLDRIRQAVDTAWPLLVERIRREAAQPLEARIANLESEMQHTRDRCSEVTAKNHHLYQDVQDLEDDLDNTQ
jgi:septal ring factor EnvC (AmiA/AmiB activator)